MSNSVEKDLDVVGVRVRASERRARDDCNGGCHSPTRIEPFALALFVHPLSVPSLDRLSHHTLSLSSASALAMTTDKQFTVLLSMASQHKMDGLRCIHRTPRTYGPLRLRSRTGLDNWVNWFARSLYDNSCNSTGSLSVSSCLSFVPPRGRTLNGIAMSTSLARTDSRSSSRSLAHDLSQLLTHRTSGQLLSSSAPCVRTSTYPSIRRQRPSFGGHLMLEYPSIATCYHDHLVAKRLMIPPYLATLQAVAPSASSVCQTL